MKPDYELLLKLQQSNIDIYIEQVSLGVVDWILYSIFFLFIFSAIFYIGYKKGEFDERTRKEKIYENCCILQKK